MNKHCYRMVFNKARGILMAVAEIAVSHGRAGGETSGKTVVPGSVRGSTLRALTLSAWATLAVNTAGLIIWPVVGQAQIVADPNAPANQRPTVLAAPNGVPLVNIQTPSAAGVSRNTYSQFDVQQQGAILNNSRINVQTQLGGWVQGNPWLATGSARVILNEVNSSNPSLLQGYVEVAGSRAQVVIANPAGVTCNGGGFINASRATLTTGTPILTGGNLEGYRVQGGVINIAGAGLDTSTTDYTDLIARAVQVNAGIWANQLKVTTGANQVDAEHTVATPIAGTSAVPAFAIDVAQLGGMYAGKITLVGTETGMGVRNAGNIGASVGEVIVTAEGRLENAGRITSTSYAQLDATGSIENSGTIYAQDNAGLSTRDNIENSGVIAALGNTTLAATGTDSRITSTNSSVLGAGVRTDGSIGNGGALSINATKTLAAQGQNLSGGEQTLTAQAINLSGSQTSASDLHLSASQGDIDLTGASVAASQTLTVDADQTLRTDQATLSAAQINASAHDLSNVQGEIVQIGSGGMTLALPGNLDNTQGRIATNSDNLDLAAATLINTGGTFEHAGNGIFRIEATIFDGVGGQISSNGLLDLSATSATLDGGTTSAEQVRINSSTLSNRGGMLMQTGAGANILTASVQLDNTGGVIASNGPTTLTVGDLANQGGTIQAAGNAAADLRITASGAIDNSAAGSIAASGNTDLIADSLDNAQGQVTAGQGLNVAASQALSNAKGMLAANQQVNISASQLDNSQGVIGSVQNQTLVTVSAGALNNTAGRIEAAQAVNVSALGVNNTDGVVSGSSLSANSNAQTFVNTRGKLAATGASDSGILDINSGTLDNEGGLIQAAGALAIDTHGQTLANTHSGNNSGIIGQDSISLATGNLDNHAGYVGSTGMLTSVNAAINNTQGGILTSIGQMNLSGSSLDNQGGQIQAVSDIGLSLSGALNNTASLVRSGQTLGITAGSIVNANTLGNNQGLEGQSVSLNAQQINNQQGAVRADNALTMTSHGSINNTQGLISSGQTAILQDSNPTAKALAVTNTSGTVIAGQRLNVDSASFTGDGKALSQGDLNIKLTQNYTHTGELQATGTASFETAGTLTNQSTLLAGTGLNLKAATINNQANGEVSANQVNLKVTGSNTLTNRGLIDGQDTVIETATLNNLGTGRIYGDHVAIGATTVTNNVENGVAPVIAARDRLDIAAATINNREHALLFSAGDMAIGGSLDANKHAIGQAATLNNNSATIEALGNMAISAAKVNNTNDHFSTQTVTVSTTAIEEIQGYGTTTRIAPGGRPPRWFMTGLTCYAYNMPGCSGFNAYWYRYNHTVTETRQLSSDPARIWAGGGIAMNIGQVNNDKSQIIAGGNINVSGGSVTNTSGADQRTTTDSGTATHYFSAQPSGGGSKLTVSTSPYTPAPTVQAISSNNPMVYRQNTAPMGTGAQISARTTSSVAQTPSRANAAGVTINNGQVLSPITQVAALNGNNGSGPATVVRSGGVNISVPNNSLFSVSPNPNSGYLIETDPRFASYQQWLSSDYLLSALASSVPVVAESNLASEQAIIQNRPESDSGTTQYCPANDSVTAQKDPAIDPTIMQKRLGDGFYEQRLIREQVAQLTGRRFLEGYASDEAQYLALMNNGVTFARAHQLRPGIALSAEQMAQLTSDIVWLVEKDITLVNGQTTKALVPQVYVRVQDGDLSSSGALISGSSLTFNLSGDLANAGTIAGRDVVALTAENVANLGGRIMGNDVGVAARTDLNNIGGQIETTNSLVAIAGRDLNVISSTSIQTNAQSSRTNINQVAGLYVTGSGGTLLASAGRDINLISADILNAGPTATGQPAGSTEIVAGRDLNLGTISETLRHDIVWAPSDFRKENSSADVGSTIQTQGDIHLQAGNDLNLKAASVISDQGGLTAIAGNDLKLATGSAILNRDEVSQTGSFRKENSSADVGSTIQTQGDIHLQAGNDLNLKAASVISDQGGLTAIAGNDLKLATGSAILNRDEVSQTGSFRKENSSADVGSTIQTQGDIHLQAGNDLNLKAASVISDQGGLTAIAGNDLNLATGSTILNRDEASITKNRSSFLKESSSADVGSTIQTQGDIRLLAGNNLDAKAASVTSDQGGLTATAGNDINIIAGSASLQRDEVTVTKKRGFFSSKTTTTRDTLDQTSAIASSFSGDTVTMQAGQDLNLTGSNVVATNDVNLAVLNNVNIEAAVNTRTESHFVQVKKSGLLGGGGIGFTIGTQKQSADSNGTSTTASASTVGSIQGSVTIEAGKDYKQTGSDVLAPQGDIDISAQKIDIVEAQNTSKTEIETKVSKSGLTLALSSPVISAVQTAQHMAEAAGQTKDARMQALAGATAGLAAYDAYGKVQAGQGTTFNGKDNQIVTKDADGNLTSRDANAADKVGGISVSISVGSSKSQSNSTQTSSTAQGSTVAAGNNVNLIATGAEKESNLAVQGSQVTAGSNVTLKADDEINLLAAKSTAEQHSTNKSSSGSIGVSFGSQTGVTLAASQGRGNADGSDVTYSNTHVEAGNTLALQSGGDTTLKGAVASGKQIVADVGGNLNIESLQDTSNYESRQKSLGGSVTLGPSPSGSVSASKSKVDSSYASVIEQSGIKAGDEGFQVEVAGNIDLKGAVIASTDKAVLDGKNSLTTATLTSSDIANHAEASAESSGVNLDSSMVTQGKYGIAKGIIGNAVNSASEAESSSGQTRSAVSEGTVIITDESGQQQRTGKTAEQTVAGLNHDTANAQTAAQKQDVLAMEQKVTTERAVKQAVYKEAVKFTDESYRTMFLKKAEVYELGRDKDGNITRRVLSESEKMDLKPGADGKVHIVDNGIFNDADYAAGNGMQHSETSDPLYLIHFPEADNGISELLIAGYQKFLEGDVLGLANATQETKNIMNTYGQQGLVLDGHSRGSLTIDNAMDSIKNQINAVGNLSGTYIRFFGPAQNVLDADNTLAYLQNRDAVTDVATKNSMVIRYLSHVADPVGTLIGLNDATGGTVPEGSSVFTEQVRAATGQVNTSHNLYFTNEVNFKPGLIGDERRKIINNFWGDQTPVLVPIRTYLPTSPQPEASR